MNEQTVTTELWTAAVELAKLLGKGCLSAGVVTALSWFTLEWVLFPLRALSEIAKRQITLAVGLALVFLAHWTEIIDYGPGPRGWGAALFFGFVGGGLAPWLHGQIKARFPGVVNTAQAPPAAPGGGS